MSENGADKGEWPGEIPDYWVRLPFAECFENITSSKLKVKQKSYLVSGPIPVIDQGADQIGGYTDDSSLTHPGPLPALIFGDHTRVIKYVERPFVQGADGVKVLNSRGHDPRFAFWALKALRLPDRGYSRHFKFLKATDFPLPPLNEQRRIVAKIEELERRSRAAKQALEAIPPLLERFRQSVLAAAFRGDLTKEWRRRNPEVEPASVLLQRIRQERRRRWEQDYLEKQKAKGNMPTDDRWKAKYQEPQPLDPTSLPELPEGWEWATVETVGEIQGGIQKQPKRRPKNNAYPYLRVANVHRNKLILDEIKKMELFEGELEKLRLVEGDLLIVEGNGSPNEIGRMAVWDGSIENCVHQNHIIRVRLSEGVEPHFMRAFWSSPVGRGKVFEQAKTTTGLYTLSKSKVSGLPVPLAPVAEQRALIEILQPAFSTVETFSEYTSQSRFRLGALEQSILAKAFRGELVPQDPNDEPASALLERIRSQQNASAKR